MKTRVLHIRKAKPVGKDWTTLSCTDIFYTGCCVVIDNVPPDTPVVTQSEVWASDTFTGEELFDLWKAKMVEDSLKEIEKLTAFVKRIDTFKYLNDIPENYI